VAHSLNGVRRKDSSRVARVFVLWCLMHDDSSSTTAPNDWTELGTHAEFLGICTRAEMLAEFFTHDGGDTQTWRA